MVRNANYLISIFINIENISIERKILEILRGVSTKLPISLLLTILEIGTILMLKHSAYTLLSDMKNIKFENFHENIRN